MADALFDALFRPRAIAVIGASNDPDKLSGRPLDFLLRYGFKGGLYPVNPNRAVVQGVKAYPSLSAAPGPVDLAVVAVPAPGVLKALEDCAAASVKAAIVFASGFSECGGDGVGLQRQVSELARRTGLRVLGPNCLGTFAAPGAVLATFSSAFDEEGKLPNDPLALVSQSGAVGTFMYSTLVGLDAGVRYYANTGNECDVSAPELLAELARAEDVDVLMGYLESFAGKAHLEEAAREARQRDKPLLLLKAGRTPSGVRAVGAHTASIPGEDAEFDALVAGNGAIRVHRMEEMVDAALAFRPKRRASGSRLTIVTSSGGTSSLATDAATDEGLRVDEWSKQARDGVADILPAFGSALNPIDLTGWLLTDPELLDRMIGRIIAHDATDMILVVLGNADRCADDLVKAILANYDKTDKPFAVSWTGGSGRPRKQLLAAGVPTYTDPARAVKALAHVARHSESQRAWGAKP
jgi:acyl-CoA synthetase (NDP forming)